jgi:hypothetical protein
MKPANPVFWQATKIVTNPGFWYTCNITTYMYSCTHHMIPANPGFCQTTNIVTNPGFWHTDCQPGNQHAHNQHAHSYTTHAQSPYPPIRVLGILPLLSQHVQLGTSRDTRQSGFWAYYQPYHQHLHSYTTYAQCPYLSNIAFGIHSW